MTEKKPPVPSKKSNIISLLINPLLNYVDWEENPKIHYYSLNEFVVDRKEKFIAWQKQKSGDLTLLMEKINNLEIASNEKLKQILEIRENKIIFINFPRKKEDLQELEKWIRFADQNPPVFLLVYFPEKTEGIFVELKNENVICPLCEKSWKKNSAIKEGNFICPIDEITLSQEEVEKFTECLINDYVKRSLEIVEHAKKNKYKILQRELSLRIDFEPEILQKSLQEKINEIK